MMHNIIGRPWTKRALKALVKDALPAGIPVDEVLMETSFFGPEAKPNATLAVCLDHPRRSTFAQITLDADCNITKVK